MSRKTIRRNNSSKRSNSNEWPLVVYVWIIGLGVSGYLIARIGLYSSPHPVHWLSGLAGAIVGIGVGWVWYRKKGDIL